MTTSEVEEISFPEDNEINLDNRIKARPQQDFPAGKDKYIAIFSLLFF